MSAYPEAWRLAWPLILSNLSVPLLGIADTAVVGHLPAPHYLGAVAIGALVFNVLYFVFGFLRMATTGLTAQACGRGDGEELRAGLGRALLLAVLIAALLLIGGGGIRSAAGAIFEPGARVEAELDSYLRIRLLGAPAGLANMALLGWLLGMQDARGPMALLLVTNGVNIALDLIFVLGFGWGVAGVAAATVTAEYGGAGLGLWLVRRRLRALPGAWSWRAIGARAAFGRLLAVNRDIMLRSLCLEAAFLTFTAISAREGEVILAANAVLLNFLTFAAFGLDGFAHAAEAMVGRYAGAGSRAGLRAATAANLALALGLAVVLALAFGFGGPSAIELMTGLDAVRATALAYLPYAIALPPVAVFAFLFDGIFIGATRAPEMRNGMVLALAVFLLAAWSLTPALGNHGLWLALLLLMAARGLWLGLVYWRLERGPGFMTAAIARPLSDRTFGV
jgi:MATE family, multidrug efflux pump